jgi:hypothetical protein
MRQRLGGIPVRSAQSSPNAYLVSEAEGVASARLVIDAAGLPAHFEFDQPPRHRRSPHPAASPPGLAFPGPRVKHSSAAEAAPAP